MRLVPSSGFCSLPRQRRRGRWSQARAVGPNCPARAPYDYSRAHVGCAAISRRPNNLCLHRYTRCMTVDNVAFGVCSELGHAQAPPSYRRMPECSLLLPAGDGTVLSSCAARGVDPAPHGAFQDAPELFCGWAVPAARPCSDVPSRYRCTCALTGRGCRRTQVPVCRVSRSWSVCSRLPPRSCGAVQGGQRGQMARPRPTSAADLAACVGSPAAAFHAAAHACLLSHGPVHVSAEAQHGARVPGRVPSAVRRLWATCTENGEFELQVYE